MAVVFTTAKGEEITSSSDTLHSKYLIFGRNAGVTTLQEGNCYFLPFIPLPLVQAVFSLCQKLYVRGENSLIYALNLDIPFWWDIYKESNGAHIEKMKDFMDILHLNKLNTSDLNL